MPKTTTNETATEVVADETVQNLDVVPAETPAEAPASARKSRKAAASAPVVPKEEEPAPVPVDDRVEVYIPRGRENDDPNLFVGINGVNYLLPKGKTHKVPRAVAREITRSLMAQNRQDENSEKLMSAAK